MHLIEGNDGIIYVTVSLHSIAWGGPSLNLNPHSVFPVGNVLLVVLWCSRVLNGLPWITSSAHGMILFGCEIGTYGENTQIAGSATLHNTQMCVVQVCTATAVTLCCPLGWLQENHRAVVAVNSSSSDDNLQRAIVSKPRLQLLGSVTKFVLNPQTPRIPMLFAGSGPYIRL